MTGELLVREGGSGAGLFLDERKPAKQKSNNDKLDEYDTNCIIELYRSVHNFTYMGKGKNLDLSNLEKLLLERFNQIQLWVVRLVHAKIEKSLLTSF